MQQLPRAAKEERFPWFDRNPPEIDLRADCAQSRLHQIVVTNRDAATDDQGVAFQPAPEDFCHLFEIIRAMLDQGDVGAGLERKGMQHDGVALENLTRLRHFARPRQLISSRDNGHAGHAADLDFLDALGGQQRDGLRRHEFAARKDFLSLREIGSLAPNEFISLDATLRDNCVFFAGHVFLHDDRVGSRRQRRAGENTNCFPCPDR